MKISGMTPKAATALPPEVASRCYCNQVPWRRIVVILAGPAVNLLIALALFTAVAQWGSPEGRTTLGNLDPGIRAATQTTPGHGHGLAQHAEASVEATWHTTTESVAGFGRALASAKERSRLSSIIGIGQVTEEAVERGAWTALVVLGYVSLLLGVVNLFPFLPLDGGHIVWSTAEKVRGRRIGLSAMWAYSAVGLLLLVFLVANGVSNDITRLTG